MDLIKTQNWYYTAKGESRGYIDPHALSELWFHLGTACNLSCPFCLEGSKPGDVRLEPMTLAEVTPYIHQALALGVERFSFTGGEPLVIKEFHKILAYAANHKPCLVLTNGTKPLHQRLDQLNPLLDAKHPVSFRISIDSPDCEQHDSQRGAGSFNEALAGIKMLTDLGFAVSVARQMAVKENTAAIEQHYRDLFVRHDIAADTHLVSFPDFLTPFADRSVPEISTGCMTRYQDEISRKKFMCAYSKMMVKQNGQMRIYACTLVDDDPGYDQGQNLAEALQQRVQLKHHRCYSCFAYGASCSG
jgi:sulfatase maturation enzyme AslB (radical SAM superfamily)